MSTYRTYTYNKSHIFLLFTLSASIAAVFFTYSIISPSVAIKSIYVLAGSIFAILVYLGRDLPTTFGTRPDRFMKMVIGFLTKYNAKLFIVLFMISTSYLLISRMIHAVDVVIFMFLSLLIMVVRIFYYSDKWVLVQASLCFFLLNISKVISTGFYFAYFDTLAHVGLIEKIVGANTLVRGTGIVSEYYYFPIVHIMAAVVRILSSLPVYDSLMIFSILLFSIGIIFVYKIVYRLTKIQKLSIVSGFSIILIPSYHFYSLFAYPQSIAFTMSILLTYLLLADGIRYSYLFYVVGMTTVFIHHLIFIILTMLLVVYVFIHYTRELIDHNSSFAIRPHIVIPIFSILLSSLTYWLLVEKEFISNFVWQVSAILSSDLRGGTYTQQEVFTLGNISYDAVAEATHWLLSGWGLQSAIMISLVIISILSLAELDFDSRLTIEKLALTGLIGSLLILETPITFKGNGRISMVWIPLFSFLVACGVYYISEFDKRSFGCILGGILLITAGCLTPVVTPGDYYSTEKYDIQTKYTEQEYAELQAVSHFVEESNTKVTSLQIYRVGLDRFGVASESPESLSDDNIRVKEGLYLYGEYSSNHIIYYQNNYLYLDKVLTTEPWIQSTSDQSNLIYKNGGMGLIYNSNTTQLGY